MDQTGARFEYSVGEDGRWMMEVTDTETGESILNLQRFHHIRNLFNAGSHDLIGQRKANSDTLA